MTIKVSILGISKEYVEAYGSRAGFVHPLDTKILWAHSVRLHLYSCAAYDKVMEM
jgi:hypothetical protein